MTEFTVRGSFEARDGRQSFETEIEAPNEDVARDRAFSRFGSKHGLKRRQIDVDEVLEGAVA